MRLNLIESLRKRQISNASVSRVLGVHPDTIANKLNGVTAFTIDEAELIWKTYFPDMDYWWLFRNELSDQSA